MKNEPDNHLEPVYTDRNLHIVFSVTLMAVMGVAAVTPAFPEIVEKLGVSKGQVGLLITLFTFPGILLTPLMGVLADRFGRKRILAPSLMLFGVAGAACAFTADFNTLLVLRFFQGVGAASLGSLNVTIIGDLYSGRRMTEAMGYNAGVLAGAVAVYPAIGGLLTHFDWRYPFLLPVAAIPVGLLTAFALKNPEPEARQSIKEYLRSTLESLRHKQVAGLFAAILITFILIYGALLTFLPFFMRERFNSSALAIGLCLSGVSLTSALTSTRLGRLAEKYSQKQLIFTAFVLYTVSMVVLPFIRDLWLLALPAVIFGTANGLNIPTIHGALAELAPLEHRAAFMSANGMVLRIGQTLGPIVIGTAYALSGLTGAFITGAVLAALTLILIKTLIK